MASFDFVKVTVEGYRFAWRSRTDLVKFAFPVVFVGVFCSLMVIYTGNESNVLRRGLIMLPAFFAQGFFFAELARYTLFAEPFVLWGYTRRSRIDAFGQLYHERQADFWRKSRIQGSMVIYVLLNVVNSALEGVSDLVKQAQGEPPPAFSGPLTLTDLPALFFSSALFALVLVFALWSVRLGFLSVGFSAGYSIKAYFRTLKGLYSSVPFLLTVVLVMLTVFIPAVILENFLVNIFADLPGVRILTLVMLRQTVQVFILTFITIACAYGIRDMMGGLPRQGSGTKA